MLEQGEPFHLAGRIECVDIYGETLLVTTSNLGGNSWDSTLQVVELTTQEVRASLKLPCGASGVCWVCEGQRAVAGEDSGDIKVKSRRWFESVSRILILESGTCDGRNETGLIIVVLVCFNSRSFAVSASWYSFEDSSATASRRVMQSNP